MKIHVNPNDKRYIFIQGENKEIKKLEQHLNKTPQYMLLPTFRGVPRPEVFLDKFQTKEQTIYYCAAGLWKEVYDFCINNKIECNKVPDSFKLTNFQLSKEQFHQYVLNWKLSLVPREYQIDAAWLILKYRQSLSELATRAGKTLILYIVARAAMELMGVKKILLIVPSIHLVKQGAEDLSEYQEFFKSEQIWSQGEHVDTANLTIGTFQSLVLKADPRSKKYNPSFFQNYDFVCVDEAHKLPCKSIKQILKLDFMKNVKIQFGFTGTLPKENTIEYLCCQAMMGPKIQEITARELIDEGYLAEPIIQQIRIDYNEGYEDVLIKCAEYLCSNDVKKDGKTQLLPKEQRLFTMTHQKTLPKPIQLIKQRYAKQEYIEYLKEMLRLSSQTLVLEQMMVQQSQTRLEVIDKIINELNKNVIVFAHNTEYINYLSTHLKQKFPDRIIKKITGSTTLKKRQQVLDEMLKEDNVILVGSFGAVGTGLTFRNVDNAIFAQSFKSEIITNQSLGRAMLLSPGKTQFNLFDIIDVFPSKKIYNQGLAKIRTYKEHQYKYSISHFNTVYSKIDAQPIHLHTRTEISC